MAKKVSKNARVAQRAANAGSGKDHVRVVKSVKDPNTGKYSYKEVIVHKDQVEDFFKNK
ncbi:DUF4295 domain-containing protein [Saprospira grandis]|uniref:DUF4295 domain-containing protein n=2 Tax=Saprospira grandis TaxID=1008 RepID=H6L4V6_SAPGL|nr:DUF4295 domain-containing protein [Saprospira grandis]AFC25131.1 hypothetical protein SGRA_2403 [Saprospira grandis str. Lewin]EJF52926.1 hypothetical protein SapgrDRAFT_1202 [Saprospira grandis DSM 2844]WBM73252.1 DUF4295 domain-containing protein [Saprospira grandis]